MIIIIEHDDGETSRFLSIDTQKECVMLRVDDDEKDKLMNNVTGIVVMHPPDYSVNEVQDWMDSINDVDD